MRDLTKTVLICILAMLLNFVVAYFFLDFLHLPLFLDTIFTVAVTFYCGLVPGICVAVGYNIIATSTTVIRGFAFEPLTMLFGITGALIVLVTWFFARKKDEFRITPVITLLYLVLISVLSSFVAIVSSGFIDYFRYTLNDFPDRIAPIKEFTYSFVHQKFSLFASCFLGQIPVSLTDRFITTFAGFGVYKLMVRQLGEEKW